MHKSSQLLRTGRGEEGGGGGAAHTVREAEWLEMPREPAHRWESHGRARCGTLQLQTPRRDLGHGKEISSPPGPRQDVYKVDLACRETAGSVKPELT